MWMFAALATVEPPIVDRDVVENFEQGKSWQGERFEMVDERIRERLNQLSARLDDSEWLDGDFSAGDLLMVHVLQRLQGSEILEEFPNLSAYVARAEARSAYKRAFAAQLAVFTGASR
jgi:glutathione S-transferase